MPQILGQLEEPRAERLAPQTNFGSLETSRQSPRSFIVPSTTLTISRMRAE